MDIRYWFKSSQKQSNELDNFSPPQLNTGVNPENQKSYSFIDSSKLLPPDPYQLDVADIPFQTVKGKNLQFQQKWFEKYTWLHFDTASGRVLCHICATAKQDNLLDLAKRANDSFLSKAFKNWKKGIEKFDAHERSNTYRLALSNNLQKKKGDSVLIQINCSFLLEQKQARTALLKIISSSKYLAGQGLAIQGSNSDDGNFNELLNLRAEDISGLHSWLARKHSCTSHPI